MGPKLLPRKEIETRSTQETTGSILRIKEIRDLEHDWRLKLGKAEKDFETTLASHQKMWAKEYEDHTKDVKERNKEIETLEARRTELLIPIDAIKITAEEKIKEAEIMLQKVLEREKVAEEIIEQLQDKLDAVGEHEIDIDWREKKVIIQEGIVRSHTERTKLDRDIFNNTVRSFNDDLMKRNAEIQELEVKSTLRIQTLNAQEESIKRTEKSQLEEARYLKDQREVLKRAFDEVRRMRIPQDK